VIECEVVDRPLPRAALVAHVQRTLTLILAFDRAPVAILTLLFEAIVERLGLVACLLRRAGIARTLAWVLLIVVAFLIGHLRPPLNVRLTAADEPAG
jgi:hypothetical protein